jgi:hypothetical protein
MEVLYSSKADCMAVEWPLLIPDLSSIQEMVPMGTGMVAGRHLTLLLWSLLHVVPDDLVMVPSMHCAVIPQPSHESGGLCPTCAMSSPEHTQSNEHLRPLQCA